MSKSFRHKPVPIYRNTGRCELSCAVHTIPQSNWSYLKTEQPGTDTVQIFSGLRSHSHRLSKATEKGDVLLFLSEARTSSEGRRRP